MPDGYFKYRCKYRLYYNCEKWNWVNQAPCADCLAEGRVEQLLYFLLYESSKYIFGSAVVDATTNTLDDVRFHGVNGGQATQETIKILHETLPNLLRSGNMMAWTTTNKCVILKPEYKQWTTADGEKAVLQKLERWIWM